jgi:hypothetical protein
VTLRAAAVTGTLALQRVEQREDMTRPTIVTNCWFSELPQGGIRYDAPPSTLHDGNT